SQILQTSQVSETCEVSIAGVVFDRVSFAYDADEPVLSEVSFSLPAGKVLGLLGRTGSGKTTTARLLLRIHDTSAGEIRVGGAPIRQMPLEKLRQTVSMVTQEVQLFHASVRDNLTFFDRAIPDARIEREMIDLGLGAWLARMPRGLDTELQSGGAGLSAGESQLLAFGRLFLRDPRVVILDEASSRLDPVTEALIERAVDRLLAGRTGIIIAHRLATIHRADYIMILEDGQIAEFGERVALAQDPASRFSHLLRTGLEEALV
ncbi:MAG: ATP-binding cassette domain-containing protein, partial [Anaerolineae bacterium]